MSVHLQESYEQILARNLRKIADEVERSATNGGKRALDERWAAGAIKRLAASNDVIHGMLRTKLAGPAAAAKIAVSKAKTPADLRDVAAKLERALNECTGGAA